MLALGTVRSVPEDHVGRDREIRKLVHRRLLQRAQRGELLVESLISVAVMATLFVAVFAAFGVLAASAQLNTRIARASNEATALAEAVAQVPYYPCSGSDLPNYKVSKTVRVDDPTYVNAGSVTLVLDPSATDWQKAAVYPRKIVLPHATEPAATKLVDLNGPVVTAISNLQTGGRYTADITKIDYLTDGDALTAAFQSTCPSAGSGGDQGVQRITVTVASADNEHKVTTNVVTSKRDDRCPSAAQRPSEIVDGQRC